MSTIDSTYWSDMVSRYEALYEPLGRQHAAAIRSTVEIEEESKILDVAAGTGSLALLVVAKRAEVLA